MSDPSPAPPSPSWSTLLGIGGATALILVGGLGAGWLADSLLTTFPIFVFVGLVVGVAVACRYIYLQFRRFLKT
jgi:F0F1-type ATP synthase assembly protein I